MRNAVDHIVDRLFDNARTSPNAIAFTVLEDDGSERKMGYAVLAAKVKELAFYLNDRSLAGKRVLLVYQDILEFIISFLACQYAGIIPVPVPYIKGSKQIARLLAIMEDAQAAAVFCTHDSVPHLEKEFTGAGHTDTAEIISTDILLSGTTPPPDIRPVTHEISFIQYTSGSTGKPKGVIITGKNLMHNQYLIEKTFGCNKDSVIFSWLPFHHDMGLIGNILHTLYTGCTCVLMSPLHFIQTPLKWLKAISAYKVTHSGGPNFAYDHCVDKILPDESAELDLSSWKVAYNGSEPVRQATLQRFTRRFGSAGFTEEAFYPCYGLAEATLLVAGFKKEDRPVALLIRKERHPDGMITLADETDADAQAVISSGTVFSGMEVRIISPEDRHECMELREGEICISGDSVTGGYWNRDNRDIFYEYEGKRFLRTGDLGFFYKGALFVQGRLTEMLIVRGRNIYPYDIEQSVSASHGAIEMNGVAAFCINPSGEELVIAAEIKRAFINGLDAEAVIRTIDRIVSGSYGVKLHDIILLSPLGIPRTTSGKLQRIKCREYYREGSFKEIASLSALSEKINNDANLSLLPVEVRGEINHATISNYLTGIIGAKIGKLHIDELNDKTELTEIGIDSLKATELINIINRDLSINIDAAKVFRDNSISGLINTIENLLWLKNEQTFGEEITI